MIVFGTLDNAGHIIGGIYGIRSSDGQTQLNWIDPSQSAFLAGNLRRTRPITDIHNDVMNLTSTQQDNIWTALSSGDPELYLTDTGNYLPNIMALHCFGKIDHQLDDHVRLGIAVFYAADNPNYLVHPTFDSTINVAGDIAVGGT